MSEKRMVIDGFLGVDASTSPDAVKKNRATEIDNLININGVNHKRGGFVERIKFSGKINGMWKYSEGGNEVYIVHAGTKLYRVVSFGSNPSEAIYSELVLPAGAVVNDSASHAISNNGILHILCGCFMYYLKRHDGKYGLEPAQDNKEYTYIPTTATSIDSEDAAKKLRVDFEKVNVLTRWRINTLQGMPSGTQYNATDAKNRTYYLDTSIDENEVTVEIDTVLNGTRVQTSGKNKKESNGKWGETIYKLDGKELTDEAIATVNFLFGKIVFESVIVAIREDEDNIKVTFAYAENSYEQRINKCRFGTQFGLHGNNDRLFLSGAPQYPNMDFYSGSNDFTYFPDQNYTVFGSSHSAITGYSRINDGSIGVHKADGDSSSIYYRTSNVETMTDAATGATVTETVFPIQAGALGEFCVSPRTCNNLSGDPLFLSKSGVYAMTLGNNVVINERYAKERSENISPLIKQHAAISGANTVVDDGKYYLYIDNKCYIADSRYKYTSSQLKDDTFNYEWWVWTMPDITTNVYRDESIVFIGTAGGSIYTQQSNMVDKRYEVYRNGDVSVSTVRNGLILNSAIKPAFADGYIKVIVYGITADEEISNREILSRFDIRGDILRLYNESGEPLNITGSGVAVKLVKVIETPVTAKLMSPLFDLGSSVDLKTVNTVFCSTDQNTDSELELGYKTRLGDKTIAILQSGWIDLSDIDFDDWAFGVEVFASSIVRPIKLRNINYIQFYIKSDNDKDAVLSNLGITYQYSKKIHGGII